MCTRSRWGAPGRTRPSRCCPGCRSRRRGWSPRPRRAPRPRRPLRRPPRLSGGPHWPARPSHTLGSQESARPHVTTDRSALGRTGVRASAALGGALELQGPHLRAARPAAPAAARAATAQAPGAAQPARTLARSRRRMPASPLRRRRRWSSSPAADRHTGRTACLPGRGLSAPAAAPPTGAKRQMVGKAAALTRNMSLHGRSLKCK